MAVKIEAFFPVAGEGSRVVVGGDGADVDQKEEPDGMGEDGLPGELAGVGAAGVEFCVHPMLEDQGGDEEDECGEGDGLAARQPGESAGTKAGGEAEGEPGESEGDDGDPHVHPRHLAVFIAGFLPEETGDGVIEAEDDDQDNDLPGAVDGSAGGGNGVGHFAIVVEGVLILNDQEASENGRFLALGS